MDGPTHTLFGASVWLGGCLLAHAGRVPELGGAVLAGVAAPWCDIDNVGAWAHRRKAKRAWRLLRIRWRSHPVKYRVAIVVSLFGPHREGPMHSLLVTGLLGLAVAAPHLRWPAWPVWIGLAAGVGLVSHVILDLSNEQPVAVLWPWPVLVRGLGIPVGGAGEYLARVAIAAGLAAEVWLGVVPHHHP